MLRLICTCLLMLSVTVCAVNAGTIVSDIFSGNQFKGSATSKFTGRSARFTTISGSSYGTHTGNVTGNITSDYGKFGHISSATANINPPTFINCSGNSSCTYTLSLNQKNPTVYKTDNTANVLTIFPSAGKTIKGLASYILYTDGDHVTFVYYNNIWYIR